jgi:long-chain acyl-CoA synthetase
VTGRDRMAELRRGMLLSVIAEEAPDRIAIVAPAGNRTFAELNAAANQLVRALRERGVKRGDGIALLCGNRAEFVEVYYAAVRMGARLTPINWHLTADEAGYIVDNCEATAFVAEASFATVAQGASAMAPRATALLAVGGEIDGFERYDKVIARYPADDVADPAAGSTMLYTSGTTGRPKGVFRADSATTGTVATPLAIAVGRSARMNPETDVSLCTGPLYHAAPLAFSLVGPLNAGLTVVLMEQWSGEATLRLIEEHRVTHTHVVPTMFHRLLAVPAEVRDKYDISSLRFIVHGAAPCPVHVKQAIIDWLGPIVYEYYAATEGGGVYIEPEEWLRKPGSVGRPWEGSVAVLNEDGESCATDEVGTVYFRAPDENRFVYYKAEDKTRSAYRDDLFTLGDLGYIDRDGYLFLTGRSAELIISGGVNIYPAEVDAVLLEHPLVADAATVGVPNDEWGEEVKAVVQLEPHTQASDELADELLGHCRARLAHFKCPRSVDFVDSLPRSDAGKIYRSRIREWYWENNRTI